MKPLVKRVVGIIRKVFRRMIKVETRDHEGLEKVLKRFKKMCEKEGLSKDIKKASIYEKPSEKKARKLRTRKR